MQSHKTTVVCPHCGGQQTESDAAISTVCKSCKTYFSLENKHIGRRLKKNKPSRLVLCSECNSEQKVYEDALSAVCTACGAHLNIGSYNLEGVVRQRLSTSGDIVFAQSVRYAGPEVRGQNVTVSGKIKARVRAIEQILVQRKAEIGGALIAPIIRILKGAEAESDRIQCESLEVDGKLVTKQIFVRKKIQVLSEGALQAKTLVALAIEVEEGGSLSGFLDTSAVPASDPDQEEEIPSGNDSTP